MIEQWGAERFTDRATIIQGIKPDGTVETTVIPIEDRDILCDICNADIGHYLEDGGTVPVWNQSYALCHGCVEGIKDGED